MRLVLPALLATAAFCQYLLFYVDVKGDCFQQLHCSNSGFHVSIVVIFKGIDALILTIGIHKKSDRRKGRKGVSNWSHS